MNIIDLFSGCGGLSLGFQNAGFEIMCAYENWDFAIDIYKNNFGHNVKKLDLSTLKEDYTIFNTAKKPIDIIIGGPPCQDYSSAGKRNETLGRADLTIKYADIVVNLKPKWFVMENVSMITKSETLKLALEIFKNSGYGLTKKVINASFCGVPQDRKRFFLIGELGGVDDFLDSHLDKNLSNKKTTVSDYLGDELQTQYYYRHPRSYQRRGIYSIDEPSPTIRGVNRPVPPKYVPHKNDRTSDLSKVRPLTTIERSYIQTFPKTFKFIGGKTDLEQVIGNAVPVKLAEYVAKTLKSYIEQYDN